MEFAASSFFVVGAAGAARWRRSCDLSEKSTGGAAEGEELGGGARGTKRCGGDDGDGDGDGGERRSAVLRGGLKVGDGFSSAAEDDKLRGMGQVKYENWSAQS
ncbi:hypothetical protein GPALN_006239 [Globodera pallida]|nr:hypothetical protein GPALN_006239 [Globodera pallida]